MKYIIIKIPKILLIAIMILIIVIYIDGFVKYKKKIEAFDNKIKVGDPISKVRVLLGKPSMINNRYSITIDDKEKRTVFYVYRNWLYLDFEDLVLIFDKETGELLEKRRELVIY